MAYTLIYTTTTKVRREAGFINNTDIDDTLDILPHTIAAEAKLSQALAFQYALPLSDNSTYADSSAEGLMERIATNCAAASLMMQQYESQGGEPLEMAILKMKKCKEEIAAIKNGDTKLIGDDNEELETVDQSINGWNSFPNQESDDDQPDDNENAKFTTDQVF